MDKLEAYLFLFFDNLMVGLLLPVQGRVVLPAMKTFDGYNMHLVVFISVFAIVLAYFINWCFGFIIKSAIKSDTKNKTANKIFKFYKDKGYYILALIAPIPIIAGIFIVLAGFVRAKLKNVLLISAISNFIYLSVNVFYL